MNHPSSPWIQTYTGLKYYFEAPTPEMISITDIAHALSMMCRFTGHSKYFYSVAQHSVLVSYHTFDPFYGLMHDATEAYVGDMNRPLKSRMPSSSFYRFADNAAWVAIAQRWPRLWPPTKGISDPVIMQKEKLRRFLLKQDCKRVDLAMLVTESRDVLADGPHADWEINQNTNPPYPEKIEPWTPHEAERKFLERHEATISGTTCAFGVCARCDQPHSEFDTFCRGCHSLGIAKKQQRVLNLEAEVERLKAELANNQA